MSQVLTKKKSNKKKKLDIEAEEEHFLRNGGLLLEKQIALSQGRTKDIRQLKTFSVDDINNATSSEQLDHVLSNACRTIYKVVLEDRVLVVKAPQHAEEDAVLADLSLTEAATGTVMNHSNIAKLYGCCLGTYVPILVYEFLPNGSLYDHLHGAIAYRKAIKWADRLRIATDTAYALSYMHNAFSCPVVHRNVKPYSILLDDTFHAKLSNLGYSVSITPGESSQKWPIQGTRGYIDPEYIETNEVTDKCDVYSFGVLLLELLTGREPAVLTRFGTDLVDMFISAVKRNCVMEMIGSGLLNYASMGEIRRIVRLALTCVAKKAVERPTMIDVAKELRQMQGRPNK